MRPPSSSSGGSSTPAAAAGSALSLSSAAAGAPLGPLTISTLLRDFVGMGDVDGDALTRTALLDFGYAMAVGDVDSAYSAVRKLPSSTSVWSNMAHACVATGRLDVAMMCLSNMGHVQGMRAVRDSIAEAAAAAEGAAVASTNVEQGKDGASSSLLHAPGSAAATETTTLASSRSGAHSANNNPTASTAAAVGVLAVQLGELGAAARLFASAGRPDLLTRLYADCGAWDRCLAHASSADRPHLKEAHFSYAREAEARGDIAAATAHYESAGTAVEDVPRMLLSRGSGGELEAYVLKKVRVRCCTY